jgi:hypothetical protein
VFAAVFAFSLVASASTVAKATELGTFIDLSAGYYADVPKGEMDKDAYRYVRRQLAIKAMLDGRAIGLSFVRAMITGYRPASMRDSRNDLREWIQNPPVFWSEMDQLMDDLDATGMRLVPTFVWNPVQFSALAGDNLGVFLRDPQSKSRQLLAKFLTEFIHRYKDRRTILFYELDNEMNLNADLNLVDRCGDIGEDNCVWRNYTTEDMISFSADSVRIIKSLDGTRKISSGQAMPRRSAWHLSKHPVFSLTGPDWTEDTPEQFAEYLNAVNGPFDIVSVHYYADTDKGTNGNGTQHSNDRLTEALIVAHGLGKPFFLGEFGGGPDFLRKTADLVRKFNVGYAAVWGWESASQIVGHTGPKQVADLDIEPGESNAVTNVLSTLPEPDALRQLQEPSVVLTSPLPCSAAKAEMAVSAVASYGSIKVARVEFWIDGRLAATVTDRPYQASVKLDDLDEPTVSIEARAVGDDGRTSVVGYRLTRSGAAGGCHLPALPVHP